MARNILPFAQRGQEPPTLDKLDAALADVLPSGRMRPIQEATQEDWFWGRLSSAGTEEDYYWRRLSDNWSQKDVLPATYLEIHNQCYEAYNSNPFANAIIEMSVNFVLGDGLTITAPSKKVQAVLDAFWRSPKSSMTLRQYDIVTELALYGELFVRYFVNQYTGEVTVRMIDPSMIDELETAPDDIEELRRVHRRPFSVTPTSDSQPQLNDPTLKGEWLSVPDDVQHFAINKVSNAKRGKSDLATLLPWLRRYKDWLIDRVRINKYKAAFLWDVKLAGADRAAIQAKLMEYSRPPEPGSVLVHNESEEWKAVQPQIGADDVSADGTAIKLMIAMGAGIPEHWLSEGGDVNRATASEMSLPTLKRYQRRQDRAALVIRSILDRVIEEAQKVGRIPRTTDTSYDVTFPHIQPEEATEQGTTAWHMAQGLQIALAAGFLSQETATSLFLAGLRSDRDPGDERRKANADNPAQGPKPTGRSRDSASNNEAPPSGIPNNTRPPAPAAAPAKAGVGGS